MRLRPRRSTGERGWQSVVLAVQGALSPWLWHDLRTAGLAERRVLRAALLAITSVLYLLSRNFWLAWALHGAASAILDRASSSLRVSRHATT